MKVEIPEEALPALGALVADLFDAYNSAFALTDTDPSAFKFAGASVTFDWKRTGQTFKLTLTEEEE